MVKAWKLGFVVLHYCTLDMTKKSIAAIQEHMKDRDYAVVVVDNASGNGSGQELLDYYSGQEKVTVLLSERNLGFAKGNNLGFLYAKEQLKCDFICVMNNDVMLLQEDFADRIFSEFEASQFAVLGPHVELPEGKENAMYYQIADVQQLVRERSYYSVRLKHLTSRFHAVWNLWDGMKTGLRIFLGKIHVMQPIRHHEDMVEGAGERHENLVLHGCCIIFSPVYLAKFADAFDPATFMFREEELLHLRCRKNRLPIIYNPDIRILHLEDVSTNYIYKTERKKEIFNLENQIQSMGILIQRMKEMQQ